MLWAGLVTLVCNSVGSYVSTEPHLQAVAMYIVNKISFYQEMPWPPETPAPILVLLWACLVQSHTRICMFCEPCLLPGQYIHLVPLSPCHLQIRKIYNNVCEISEKTYLIDNSWRTQADFRNQPQICKDGLFVSVGQPTCILQKRSVQMLVWPTYICLSPFSSQYLPVTPVTNIVNIHSIPIGTCLWVVYYLGIRVSALFF